VKFLGFGEHAIDFYDGLEADNSKVYWDANKHLYQGDVREPMLALLAELEPEFGGLGEPKVFRPHRDTRFSKEKTPYKTHCGGVIEQGRGGGAYYVQVGPLGLTVGGGCFHLEADQLARFRAAIDDSRRGETLEKIVAKLAKAGFEIKGEQLKTKPRGYELDHPRIDLLRHKSLYASMTWEPDDVLHERGSFDRVRKAWRLLRPFNEWAADHVGVSELARR
jgi:uncharacterized protein (TIGR02453 family)